MPADSASPLDRSAPDARRSVAADDAPPLPLSVAIVCRDNADTIARTLESVATLAAEVVAVDSGSRDGTLDILRERSVRVIESPWLGHVRTKQLALDACDQPWVLSLDSDESVEPALAASIRAALRPLPHDAMAGFFVNRKIHWAGRFLEYAWQPEWRLRLVRKGACRWGGVDPHDSLEVIPDQPAQRTARLAGDVRHDSIRSMPDFLAAQAAHARTAAAGLAARGERGSVWRLIAAPPAAWLKQVVIRQAWRDGWRGWCAASATAAASLMKHAALIERTRSPAATPDQASSDTRDGHSKAGREPSG